MLYADFTKYLFPLKVSQSKDLIFPWQGWMCCLELTWSCRAKIFLFTLMKIFGPLKINQIHDIKDNQGMGFVIFDVVEE